MQRPSPITRSRSLFATLVLGAVLWPLTLAFAVMMQDDPNGFEGIPWGAELAGRDRLTKVEDAGRVQTYELKGGPALREIPVDVLRFSAVDGQFARVMIRYSGKDIHDKILDLLQQQYGRLERTPGLTTGGMVKFFNWLGTDSDITLRYDARTGQGVIFFESQVFRAKFSEGNAPSAF
ncbi:MAG: hypothetical protein AMXMBFR67_04100 [Nitrospira sp.]